MGVTNYFSTAYEQHQDGLAEGGIKSTMSLARSGMAQSGLGGKYWFCAANCAKDCRNVTYKARIKNTPWGAVYGEKKDMSKFRPFGCRAWIYLNKERREKGKTAPRALEVVNLDFASDLNTSAYNVRVKATGQILTSNQLNFDENFFPFRKEEIVDKLREVDEEIDILFKASAPIRWLSYDSNMRLGTFKRVSMGSDLHLILQSPTEPNAVTVLSIDQEIFFTNLTATTTVHQKAVGPASLTKVKGLPDTIDIWELGPLG